MTCSSIFFLSLTVACQLKRKMINKFFHLFTRKDEEAMEKEKEEQTRKEEIHFQRAQSVEQQQEDSNGFHDNEANHHDNHRSQSTAFVVGGGGTPTNGMSKKTANPSHHFDRRLFEFFYSRISLIQNLHNSSESFSPLYEISSTLYN